MASAAVAATVAADAVAAVGAEADASLSSKPFSSGERRRQRLGRPAADALAIAAVGGGSGAAAGTGQDRPVAAWRPRGRGRRRGYRPIIGGAAKRWRNLPPSPPGLPAGSTPPQIAARVVDSAAARRVPRTLGARL